THQDNLLLVQRECAFPEFAMLPSPRAQLHFPRDGKLTRPSEHERQHVLGAGVCVNQAALRQHGTTLTKGGASSWLVKTRVPGTGRLHPTQAGALDSRPNRWLSERCVRSAELAVRSVRPQHWPPPRRRLPQALRLCVVEREIDPKGQRGVHP